MKLSYAKLREEVRVDGRMALELRDCTATPLGLVVPSEGGAVLVPWHAVRWAVEATAPAAELATDADERAFAKVAKRRR